MKSSKIILAALILICAIGIVAAADIDNMKVPDGFEAIGSGGYLNEENIQINIETESFHDKGVDDLGDYLENDTDDKYTVVPGKINNTFNFTDGVNDVVGLVELVEIDNETWCIHVLCFDELNESNLDAFTEALEEFNKVNDLTPIDPSTYDD